MPWICQQLQALCVTSHIPFDALMHASQEMFQFYKRKLNEEKKVDLKSGVSTAIPLVLLDRLRLIYFFLHVFCNFYIRKMQSLFNFKLVSLPLPRQPRGHAPISCLTNRTPAIL